MRSRIVNRDVELLAQMIRTLESVIEVETPRHRISIQVRRGTELGIAWRLTVAIFVTLARPIEKGLKMLEWANLPLRNESAVPRLELQIFH